MNRRTWLSGTLAILAAPLAVEAQQEGMRWWRPTWSDVRGLGPGVSSVVIDGNPNTGPYTLHVRYPSGHTVGPHRHKSTEHVTVLSGALLVGWGTVWDPAKLKALRAGESVVVPAGVPHFSAAHEETVMEVWLGGPYDIEYVLDADDPRQ